MTTPEARALRRDAALNRARALEAARAVFDSDGMAAPMARIIELSGLGPATVYRHFPTRSDLVLAISDLIRSEIDRVMAECEHFSRSWESLVAYIDGVAQILLAHPSTGPILRRMTQIEQTRAAFDRWNCTLTRFCEAARMEGTLREEADYVDVALAPVMLSSIAVYPIPNAPAMVRRQREIILRGLRAGGASTELAGVPVGASSRG